MGLLDEIIFADVCFVFATAPVGIKKMGCIAALCTKGGKRGMSIFNDEWHGIIPKSVYDAPDDGNLHLCIEHFQVHVAFLKRHLDNS